MSFPIRYSRFWIAECMDTAWLLSCLAALALCSADVALDWVTLSSRLAVE